MPANLHVYTCMLNLPQKKSKLLQTLQWRQTAGETSNAKAQRAKQESRAGQITEGSNEVTRISSYCWEYTKVGLNSGFGIILICPGRGLVLHYLNLQGG